MTEHHDTSAPQPDPDEAGATILRQALESRAGGVSPTPDWADVQSRATREGSAVVWAVAAAVVVLVAVITVPRLLDRGDDPVLVAPVVPTVDTTGVDLDDAEEVPEPPEATPGPTPSVAAHDPTTGEQVAPVSLPAGDPLADTEIVAVVHKAGTDGVEQDLVVMDGAGEPLRTLEEGIDTAEGGIYQLSLSPDGRTVVYALGTSACTQVVGATAADGSTSWVQLADGDTPAVSPDGRWLAVDPGDSCLGESLIELRPIAGGEILRFGTDAAPLAGLRWERDHDQELVVGDPQGPVVQSMAFLDDQTLLFTVAGGAADGGLWQLDLVTGVDQRVDPAGQGGGYSALHHVRPGTVVVVHEGGDGWQVLEMTADEVRATWRPLGGEQAYQASVSEALGLVHTRGSGVQGLVVDGEQVRTDVSAAMVGPSSPPVGTAAPVPTLRPAQETLARFRADTFIEALAEGDFAAAAELWLGYPDVDGSQPGAVDARLRQLVEQADWPALAGTSASDVVVTPAWTFTDPTAAVVTYVFSVPSGQRITLPFLVSLAVEPTRSGSVIRLPGWTAAERNSLDGATFAPGATVVLPGLPIEGGAFAHVDGRAVPVEIDHEALATRVLLPDDLRGEVTLTLSTATPEAPTAESHALTISP